MALNSLHYAEVPLRNCSLTQVRWLYLSIASEREMS